MTMTLMTSRVQELEAEAFNESVRECTVPTAVLFGRKPLPRMSSTKTLARLALEGERGRHWYEECDHALRTLCAREEWPVVHTAAILGITSPRVQVVRNALYTKQYMTQWMLSPDIQTHAKLSGLLPMVRSGLEHYELTGEIRGPKTSAFAGACMGDLSQVVLDIWMARALGVSQVAFNRKPVRAKATKRVCQVAKQLGWDPAQVQAAVWTAVYEANHVSKAPGLHTYF